MEIALMWCGAPTGWYSDTIRWSVLGPRASRGEGTLSPSRRYLV